MISMGISIPIEYHRWLNLYIYGTNIVQRTDGVSDMIT